MNTQCVECGRVFDLLDETDQEEWTYGHDCETPNSTGADDFLTMHVEVIDATPR